MSFAVNLVTESMIILKYSPVENREANVGKCRAGSGLGASVTPLLISACLAFGDAFYWLSFAFTAVTLAIAAPFIYSRLSAARDLFDKEEKR